jgi:hypothetical protein
MEKTLTHTGVWNRFDYTLKDPALCTEPVFVKLLRNPGIDSLPGGRYAALFDVLARQATQGG